MGWLDRLLPGNRKTPGRLAEDLNKKAVKAMAEGNLDDAERMLLEAIRVEPNLSAAHHNLAALYLNQKRFSQALKHTKRAIRLEPQDIESRIALAKILGDMGKAEESLAEYQKIYRKEPEDWRTRISLGNALLERDRVEEAIEHLEKAVALRSKEELTHLVLAAAYERQGEWGKAIKQYEAVRGSSRIGQNRNAASERIRELQLRLSQEGTARGSSLPEQS